LTVKCILINYIPYSALSNYHEILVFKWTQNMSLLFFKTTCYKSVFFLFIHRIKLNHRNFFCITRFIVILILNMSILKPVYQGISIRLLRIVNLEVSRIDYVVLRIGASVVLFPAVFLSLCFRINVALNSMA